MPGQPRAHAVAIRRQPFSGQALIAYCAKLLQLDPIFLLGKVVAENDPDLWDVIFALLGDRLVTANEMALVRLARGQLDGHDVNLADAPEFTQAVTPVLNAIVQCQNALAAAAISRIDE